MFSVLSCATAPEETEPVAAVEISKAVEEIPEDEDVYAVIGAAMAAGDVEAAIAAFERAYSGFAQDAGTQILYASLLISARKIEQAESVIEEILADDPVNIEGLYLMSVIAGLNGNEGAQEEILLAIIELDPRHGQAHASLGEIRLRNGSYGPAGVSFEKSLAVEPDSIVALMGYGNVLLRTSEPELAVAQFDRVIEQTPDYVFAYVDRSRAKMENEDYIGAYVDLTTAIELDSEQYWHYIDRGKVRLLGLYDSDGALADFNRAIEIDHEYFYAYVYRGGILDQREDRIHAIEDYLKVLDARPDYRYIYAPVGVLLYMEDRFREARVFIQKAYDFNKDEHFYAFLVALALKKEGLESEVEEYLREAIRGFPQDSLYYRLARIFFEPSSIGQVTGEVSLEQNIGLKMKSLFVLATHYLVEGQTVIAQKYFLEVEDKAYYDAYERRLSTRELEPFRGKGETNE